MKHLYLLLALFGLTSCAYVNIFWQCREIITDVEERIKKSERIKSKADLKNYYLTDCTKLPSFDYPGKENPKNRTDLCNWVSKGALEKLTDQSTKDDLLAVNEASCMQLKNEMFKSDITLGIITSIFTAILCLALGAIVLIKYLKKKAKKGYKQIQ
ncbi:uncharacterized protein MONOS_11824 [Monocercomonoides exilis]|uniref:uncharacterized protein n=1 Tax=Monocercomonoides exilis TaxID=2049356 RepID=UPI0035599656|nr:hypothetical protein MONOS_11824 [Monocercomonoides exilis]|eukprot:MONOS_11824.1-p1 / transcript=MONOS_11824.1 / gene=MONOS_11824 / organism=Monocercomonoides_exilis_PA203 / gene_product=unspecified product / transcript_product=unspecified product / location=Mono_scaffold00615:37307-37958(-) / protein_length=156 / sequence_SO=supercontig / SO=protein_coding / is_pseudo=false